MSIFESLCTKSTANKSFWDEIAALSPNLQSKPIIFQGHLQLYSKPLGFYRVEMFLTKNSFYYISSQGSIFIAHLKWCLLQPFSEISETNGEKFGFSLKHSSGNYDFFTESETELNNWVEHLSCIAVMEDFDSYYITVKNIDSGQFGTVDLCLDLESNLEFAVKKLKKAQLNTPRALNSLYNEIKIQKKLSHPNVVKLFKVFEDTEFVYLVMEYVKEGNLFRWISQEIEMSQTEIMIFAKNLLEVVQYIHEQGVIHRDLKPENILMTSKQSICNFKIADFGLACYIRNHESTCTGSPGYVAPEVLRGERYSSKVDVFGVGIIVFILLTGYTPFGANSAREVIANNLKCEIPFRSSCVRRLPQVIQKFLMQALKAEQALRPSAEEMLRSEWLRERKYSDSDATSLAMQSSIVRSTEGF